jgi:hypothetical protein
MKYENIKNYSDEKFRRICGMKKATFATAIEILNQKYIEEHSKNVRKSGRKPKLSMEDKLLATLEYLREYRTLAHIAASYDIAESNIQRIIKWVENTLIKDGTFSLPGKKSCSKAILSMKLFKSTRQKRLLSVQKNRQRNKKPIKNRKNKQKKYYSSKKKRHTIKTMVVVDKKTRMVICTDFCNGKRHDFRLYKESKTHIHKDIQVETDTGFIGITKIHANSVLPKKRSKKNPLTKEDKKRNKEISSSRVRNEHAIGFIKRFRVVSDCG